MKFKDLKVGESARILGLAKLNPLYKQKLMAMGFLPGTEFTLSRIAPLGDPIEIIIRGYALSLRKKEAEMLSIERKSDG